MALDLPASAPPPPEQDHVTGDGRFYCARCDTLDCEWLGICQHTPQLWISLNPQSEAAKSMKGGE